MSGPYIEDKLATVKNTVGSKARCTTEQLRQRFGCVVSPDGKAAKVVSMQVSYWRLVAPDVWEVCE